MSLPNLKHTFEIDNDLDDIKYILINPNGLLLKILGAKYVIGNFMDARYLGGLALGGVNGPNFDSLTNLNDIIT